MKKKSHQFKLPKAFLNQLDEFTNGYYLLTVNEKLEFETYFNFPNKLVEVGMINQLDIESTDFQNLLRENVPADEDEEDLNGAED